MRKLIKERPGLVFMPYAGNLILYGWLLAHNANLKGIAICASMAALGLWFLFRCVSAGFVFGNGKCYTVEKEPRQFWGSMIAVFGWYLIVTLMSIGFYLQDIGYLNRD
jgi:hypothetical protein